ncbi:heterokaryon incompatibility protein-domain-containing protein [Ustulina deusta]|nr:heterokaryon incompatibility protein-domain-containing protein [Ustulina deusta]
MSATDEELDKSSSSIQSIIRKSPTIGITAQLIKIQLARIEQQKSLEFLKHLECLYFLDKRVSTNQYTLHRQQIDAFNRRKYVALSYTWDPSPFETSRQAGGYQVEQKGSDLPAPSPVRDSVFNRIQRYMEHTSTKYLWIDQHGIEQEDGEEKELGIHAMDRVYSLSEHPVALLTRPVNRADDLELLNQILNGQLVEGDGTRFRLSTKTSLHKASSAIRLLEEITSDTWFTRCWTFQENYRAGIRMELLIPHPPALSGNKPPLLGFLDGELRINSADFHEKATQLCLAYQKDQPGLANSCGQILNRVGKYKILLQNGDCSARCSMTPTIMKDLISRELKTSWDRLVIAANCCQYSVWLDRIWLRDNGCSLSLSLLTLCLLNGEILSNQPQHMANIKGAQVLPIADFLKTQFFNKIQSPGPRRSLTFNKGCRFVDVKLTEAGIQTVGHLWQTDCLIPTKSFPPGYYYDRASENRLGPSENWRLQQLVDALNNCRQRDLAERLDAFLEDNYSSDGQPLTFSREWQIRMANLVALAIDEGTTLCTAYLINGPQTGCAIIITEQVNQFFFTAFAPGRDDSDKFDSNDVDKHVSIEVACGNLAPLPKLYTKRWVHGLFFFRQCSRQEVVFPWPPTLQNL